MVMITRNGHSLPLLLILVETSNLLSFDRSVCFAEPQMCYESGPGVDNCRILISI